MNSIATTRSLSELTGHVRGVATELAEWDYVYTGRDGKGAAVMMHPLAGSVRIHHSPKSKTGARLTILRMASQQLQNVGIKVELPWRPDQPKNKEVTDMPEVAGDKVKLNSGGLRERITTLAMQGKLGETFGAAEVYEYLKNKYILPSWAGDGNKRGYVAVSQALTQLAQNGALYREKQPNPDGKPRFVYRSALTEKPIPEPEPEPTPELDVPLAAAEPEELPVHDLMPPVPEEAPTTPAPPISAPPMPAEALEVLRGYFVGDIEAENELLREAFTDVVALLQATAAALSSAAENAAEALTAVGERRRPAASQASQIGVLRETRLQQLIEHSPHNTEVHYKDHAKRSGLLAPDANNALNVAKRTGWRSPEGYTVTQNRRGYYIINSPKEAS